MTSGVKFNGMLNGVKSMNVRDRLTPVGHLVLE